jgi:cell division transport system permease protein
LTNNNKKGNQYYVLLSTSIVLFFAGLYLLLFLHANNITQILKEKVKHVVEFNDSYNKQDLTSVLNHLEKREEVIKESITFIEKSEATDIMEIEMDTSLFSVDSNPFRDVVIFNLFHQQSDASLEGKQGIRNIYSQSVLYDQLKSNLFKVGWVVLGLAILFGLLALVIIFSTLNLKLYADRFEIKTMELVGAEDDFIRKPYIQEATKLGVISGIISSLLIGFIFLIVKYGDSFFGSILQWHWLVITIIIVLSVGILFLRLSSSRLINKYLSKQLYDLYN